MRLALIFLLLFPNMAFAYLDPITGSVFLQVIIGIVTGAIFTVKMWWKHLVNMFRKKPSETPPSDQK